MSPRDLNFGNWARLLAWVACLVQLAVFVPAALAQPRADLEINTPAVTALREALRQRHRESLREYYVNGAVGLTQDGQVAIRDANLIPLAQRQKLAGLVAGDNQDRLALYREVARANQHPEWESEIRATFAKRWIERIPAGWYYQDAAGVWVRK